MIYPKTSGIAYNAVIGVSFEDQSLVEPVTLQEAKDWCRIDVADEDALITELITAARIMCEKYANISFIERKVNAELHNGLGRINLPYGPVIGAADYIDDDLNVVIGYCINKPCYHERVTAIYNAGYATGELPANLKEAVLKQVAYLYTFRGDENLQSVVDLGAKNILNQVKRPD